MPVQNIAAQWFGLSLTAARNLMVRVQPKGMSVFQLFGVAMAQANGMPGGSAVYIRTTAIPADMAGIPRKSQFP